jgi:predicted small metal-binding protein
VKTITCTQLGGNCYQKLSAYTWEEMVKVIAKHFTDRHPKELARELQKANTKDPLEWAVKMKPKWDAAPEQGKTD